MPKKPEFGLLIDYEYCTGCYTCQIACAQEHGWEAGIGGIRVQEIVQALPNDKAYLTYLPFPTELCMLCKPRTKKELDPACVKHCMSGCMTYGTIDELAKKLKEKPRQVLWVPR
jgi:Fe-S-cluster-containing dehydrogenase component